jgi:antitoxin component YwqK of YwqJK toxin-antitoxin module
MKPINGIVYERYPNGKVKREEHFKEGKPHGLHYAWYEDGQMGFQCQYSNGFKDGLEKSFY